MKTIQPGRWSSGHPVVLRKEWHLARKAHLAREIAGEAGS
jgi:hypothetical protein